MNVQKIECPFKNIYIYFMLANIKAFIFDMDGVLLDTETICFKTWILAGKEFNVPTEKIAELNKKCLGTNKNDTFCILKENFGSNFDSQKFMERTSELFKEIEKSDGIGLMPFAKEALTFLKEQNYRISLASSTRGIVVRRQLKEAGLLDFFETITTGDMVSHSKPDPEIYRLACQSLNLPPSKCIAVEDSPNGIKSAKSAGLSTVMIPDKIEPTTEILKQVDFLLKSLDEIRKL